MQQTGSRRFILSTGCVVMTTSPLSNLRAVREVAESASV
jgi:uroporphyrinogen-III decarboxylase